MVRALTGKSLLPRLYTSVKRKRKKRKKKKKKKK